MKVSKMLILITFILFNISLFSQNKKLMLGIDGLSHGHVFWVFTHPDTSTFEIVGIAEPNRELAVKMSKRYGFSMDIVYPSLEALLKNTKPEAIAAFNSPKEHLNTLKYCAPKGIHVMVEKPLALNYKDAVKMHDLALKYNVKLITNYETTWYPSNKYVYNKLNEQSEIGKARRIIVNDGHNGPKEIKVGNEFLEWLTDPKKNGGGAITDFGCYGANLITWLKKGELPNYVYATKNTIKPNIYPNVDDDATIVLEYDDMVGVLQPSWNWPFSRKDMEVYGETGYVIARDKFNISYKFNRKDPEKTILLKDNENPRDNAFSFLKAVVRNEILMDKNDLSGIDNNLKVMKILDAARKSARTGKKVKI